MSDLSDAYATHDAELWLTYVVSASVPISSILAVVLLGFGTAVVFVHKRPGRYWMLAGALVFVAAFFYYVIFRIYFRPELLIEHSLLRAVIAKAAPVVPLALFSIGFARLTWSLRKSRGPDRGPE